MTKKNDRWLSQTGLNLIRIVIGSYFLAVSLDLVAGVDQKAIFTPFCSPQVADLAGSTLLLFTSVLFMTGIELRTTSLMLALFVLTSSLIQNILHFELGNVSDFWRDVTLVCAVILNYTTLGRRDLRHASVLARHARIRRHITNGGVTPRRVTVSPGTSRSAKTAERPVPSTTPPLAFHASARAATPEQPKPEQEDNLDNIFVSL